MKPTLNNVDNILNVAYTKSKSSMIPTSIKEIYNSLGESDILVARELEVNNRTLLGIEYDNDGYAVSAYSTDNTGKRIVLDVVSEEKSKTATESMSRRLDELAKEFYNNRTKTKVAEDNKTNKVDLSKVAKEVKTQETEVKKVETKELTNDELLILREKSNNRSA